MTTRTTRTAVTFTSPFFIGGLEDPLPAGAYDVDTDEELIEGLSFLAYRRVQTVLYVPGEPGQTFVMRMVTVDPGELDAALEHDRFENEAAEQGDAESARATTMNAA